MIKKRPKMVLMKALLVLVISFMTLISLSFAESWSPVSVVEGLKHDNWQPWLLKAQETSFKLLSVQEDLSQAIVIKPSRGWSKEFKADTWYDSAEGSSYFFEKGQVVIFIYDFAKRPVSVQIKNQVINTLNNSWNVQTTFHKKKSFSLISSAYAEECMAPIGSNYAVDTLASASNAIGGKIYSEVEKVAVLFSRCIGNVAEGVIDGIVELGSPIKMLKESYEGMKALVNLVANIQEAWPMLKSKFQNMSAEELIDVACPIIGKMALGIVTGKLAMDGAKVIFTLIKELKVVKKVVEGTGKLVINLKYKKPKWKPLKVNEKIALTATREYQDTVVATFKDGFFYVNGEKLPPGRYAAVILDDGRTLIHQGKHFELVMPGDKVGTAFEVNILGKHYFVNNQSGTFMPVFEDTTKWLKWWLQKEKVKLNGEKMPFNYGPFRN